MSAPRKRGREIMRRSELRHLMPARAHDSAERFWLAFAFLYTNALAQYRPGRFYTPGRLRPDFWPEADLDSVLGGPASPARQAFDSEVQKHGRLRHDWIIEQILEGIKEGESWTRKHRRLVTADEAAKRLAVSAEEWGDLHLKTIGNIETTSKAREAEAKDRKRERDRQRAAEKRRASGCVPREQYEARSARKEAAHLGVSVSTLKRLRKAQIEPGASREAGAEIVIEKQLDAQSAGQIDAPLPSTPCSQGELGASLCNMELRSIDNSIRDGLGSSSSGLGDHDHGEREPIRHPERWEGADNPHQTNHGDGVARIAAAPAADDDDDDDAKEQDEDDSAGQFDRGPAPEWRELFRSLQDKALQILVASDLPSEFQRSRIEKVLAGAAVSPMIESMLDMLIADAWHEGLLGDEFKPRHGEEDDDGIGDWSEPEEALDDEPPISRREIERTPISSRVFRRGHRTA